MKRNISEERSSCVELLGSRSSRNEQQMNDDRDFNDFDFVSVEFREPFFASQGRNGANLDLSAGESRLVRNFKGQTCLKDKTVLDLQIF